MSVGEHSPGVVRVGDAADGVRTLAFTGRLDAASVAQLWTQVVDAVAGAGSDVVVDAGGLSYCDGAGIGLIVETRRLQDAAGRRWTLRGMPEPYAHLLAVLDSESAPLDESLAKAHHSFVERLGRGVGHACVQIGVRIAFLGELALALTRAARHPRSVRWKDAWLIAEKTGADALPVIALIAVLMGLIMAFQGAVILAMFGMDIFIADMVAISLVRELAPLVTAVILAGRTGSAFAAELGTMKVGEELDALTTLALDPVRFLVVTRVLATVAVMPLLTLFFNLFGLLGGAAVSTAIGIPFGNYLDRALDAVDLADLAGGLGKSLVLGFLIAAIGCMHGLRTRSGAQAVGQSATRAVVDGLVLIVIADGIFAVIFYCMGI